MSTRGATGPCLRCYSTEWIAQEGREEYEGVEEKKRKDERI